MKKILFVFGTRPEAIKLAPIILAMQANSNFSVKICITAQHRSMLDSALYIFGIRADWDLDIMQESQDLYSISANILLKIKPILEEFKPHFILIHGDTSSSLIAGLAGFYAQIPICHIEAGLRTHNKYNPFPEEMNRTLSAQIASFHFAPTKMAAKNLYKENIKKSCVKIVGNSVIDALILILEKIKNDKVLRDSIFNSIDKKMLDKKFILVTAHRRESFGSQMENIAQALKQIALENPHINIIYPLHLNPNVNLPMREILGQIPNIFLIQPLNYESFIFVMSKAHLILTDSGGIQEEATFLHKPTLVLRNTTERKEGLKTSTLKLIGTDKSRIVKETSHLLNDKKIYKKMSNIKNPLPFGDGKSAIRIIKFLQKL